MVREHAQRELGRTNRPYRRGYPGRNLLSMNAWTDRVRQRAAEATSTTAPG